MRKGVKFVNITVIITEDYRNDVKCFTITILGVDWLFSIMKYLMD